MISDRIFGKDYASKVENILEAELYQIEEKKAAIVEISVLWAQGDFQSNIYLVQFINRYISNKLGEWLLWHLSI